MNHEHKAIIEAAEKEGLLPMERCARLVVHDMVKATRAQMARYEVGYNKMTEKQQDAVLGELEAAFTELSLTVARTIASAGTPSVLMTLKKITIDTKSVITGTVEGNEKYFNELIAKAQDKSEVVLVLYERQYADAMDDIQSDKDQKSLPLEGDGTPAKKAKAAPKAKADKKPIDIPAKQLTDARDFVTFQQNASIKGLQNLLKCGYERADAILKVLEGEGLVAWVGDDVNGQYELVRRSSAPSSEPTEAAGKPTDDEIKASAVSFDTVDELTDDLYDKIKAKVIADQSVSAGALSVAFDCEFEVAELAIERLETEGVVGEEDDMGNRTVEQAA